MKSVTKEQFSAILQGESYSRSTLEEISKSYPYFELPVLLLADRAMEKGKIEQLKELKEKHPLFFASKSFAPLPKIEVEPQNSQSLQLIDSFLTKKIEKLPTTENVACTTTKNLAAANDSDIISENYAQILASQGYFERAIEIYNKLILTIPEKSVYFASCIELIKGNSNKK